MWIARQTLDCSDHWNRASGCNPSRRLSQGQIKPNSLDLGISQARQLGFCAQLGSKIALDGQSDRELQLLPSPPPAVTRAWTSLTRSSPGSGI